MLTSIYLSPTKAVLALIVGVACALIAATWIPVRHWPFVATMTLALAWASMVDIDRRILPNIITLGLTLLGLAFVAVSKPDALVDHIIGAAVGYGTLVTIAVVYRIVRSRDGIGYGDAKMFAAGGAWLGWSALPVVMLVASVTALAFLVLSAARGRKIRSDSSFSFGPFLALGIWTTFLVESST